MCWGNLEIKTISHETYVDIRGEPKLEGTELIYQGARALPSNKLNTKQNTFKNQHSDSFDLKLNLLLFSKFSKLEGKKESQYNQNRPIFHPIEDHTNEQ